MTAYYDCEVGLIEMDYEEDKLVSLKIVREAIGENNRNAFTDNVYHQICEYFAGERQSFDVKYEFRGTPFQISVWKELEQIPYGKTMTYGDVAAKINNPKAARAVGGACNKNPIWLIVPCHRVVGSGGLLTGYASGVDVKEKLLRLEMGKNA